MDYCGPRAVPYGDFMDDRVWSPLSRDAALAWQERENARCGSCGQVKADWMAQDEDGNLLRYRVGPDGLHVFDDDGRLIPDPNGEPFEATPPPFIVDYHVCFGCAAIEQRRANEKELPPGVRHAFRRPLPPAEVD